MSTVAEKSVWLEQYESVRDGLPGAGLAFVERLRQAGIDRFQELGLPTPELEGWRFTRIEPVVQTRFSLAGALGADAPPQEPERGGPACAGIAAFDAHRLVFIEGRLSHEHSSPAARGIAAGSLAGFLKAEPRRVEGLLGRAAGRQDGAFAALNDALFSDGALVVLPRGVSFEKPIHLLFLSRRERRAVAVHTRVLVAAESGSRAVVIEEHAGRAPEGLATAVTELLLAEDASLDYVRVQRADESSYLFATLAARLERNARLATRSVDLGGAIVRNDLRVTLEGEGAEARLDGLYLARGRQLIDNNTVVDHAAPHGTSRELYKGVLDGEARAVFNGAIVVQPDAQKTDAMVYNKNLLLSEKGLVNTKPEFKIFANDVQCKHGATIGQLSADALFYLRARGIAAADARAILVTAFAAEALSGVPVAPLREALLAEVGRRLGGHLE